MILGSSIEPEKPSVKSASTPYPPQKVIFMPFLLNLSLLNCSGNNLLPITELLATLFWSLVLYCPLPFFGTQSTLLL
jgi:hypothetical protein